MTIDLRYVLPIVAFYAPGLMMLLGGLVLGFSLGEMRYVVAFLGGFCGAALSIAASTILNTIPPIKVRLFK